MTRRPLLLVFLACALPRLAALAVWPVDTDTLYYALSSGLVRDHLYGIGGGVTTRIEPFYPFALAAGRLFTGDHPEALLVLQILAAAAAGALLFGVTEAQTGDRRAAWIAAMLYAVSPYLIRQSVAFMEVTAAIVLLVCAAWYMQPRSRAVPLLLGLLLGAIVLTRFAFLPIALGALVILLRRDGARRALAIGAAAAAVVIPWLIFSRAVSGAALPARIGENLFVSTSEYARPIVPRLNADLLLPLTDELVREDMKRRGVREYDLTQQDRLLFGWAVDFMRTRPLETIAMKAKNLGYIVQPRLLPFYEMSGRATVVDGRLQVPEQRRRPMAFEIVAAGYQTLLLAGGLAGFLIRRPFLTDDAFLIIVAASVIAMNVVFFPTSRLLAPMTFVWMFYAAAALTAGVKTRRRG